MNIGEFKERAFFFQKGKILPNWVVKVVAGNKKHKHRIKSKGCYVLVRNKVMYITPQIRGDHSIEIRNLKNIEMTFNPYSKCDKRFIFIDQNNGEFEKVISELK